MRVVHAADECQPVAVAFLQPEHVHAGLVPHWIDTLDASPQKEIEEDLDIPVAVQNVPASGATAADGGRDDPRRPRLRGHRANK